MNLQQKICGNGWNWNKTISSTLVPLMIGILTIAVAVVQIYIANQQREQDLFLANQTNLKELEIAEKNHQQALFLASEQQKDTVLNDYLNFLAEFLEKNNNKSSNNLESILIVQFKTFAVLEQLDARRKVHIIQALYNTGLIRQEWTSTKDGKQKPLFFSLRYANLSNIELGTFSEEVFQRDLSSIFLRYCVLTNASFRHLDISGADFTGTQLQYADFMKTDASTRSIEGTLSFDGASLVGARFIEANYKLATFTDAILDDAFLQQFQCQRCGFFGTTARRADFSSAIITEGQYSPDDLSNSLLYNATVISLTLYETKFDRANATQSLFVRCIFDEASLIEVIFFQSTIVNSSFVRSNLTNSFFHKTKVNQTSFIECFGANVTFIDAFIENYDFTNTTIINSSFINATVKNTNFFNSTITYEDQLIHARILINVRLANGTIINET